MKILKSVNLFQTWGESKLKHQQQQDKCDSKHPEETRPLIILQSRKCFYLIPGSFRSSGATTRVNDLILHLRFVEICWVVFCVKLLTNQPTIKPQIRMKTDQNLQERCCILVPPSELRIRIRIRTTGPDGEEEQHCEPAPCVCWCYLGELGHRGRFPLMNYREPPLTRRYFTCPPAVTGGEPAAGPARSVLNG